MPADPAQPDPATRDLLAPSQERPMPDRAFTFHATSLANEHRTAVCDWVTSIGLNPNTVREFTLIDRNTAWSLDVTEFTPGVGNRDWQNRTVPVTTEDADRLLRIIGPAARYRLTRLPDPDDEAAMREFADRARRPWRTCAAVVRALAERGQP